MVLLCCAFGCNEKFKKGGPITFHRFPKNPDRRALWVKNMRRENFTATDYTKICSKHFTPDSYNTEKFGATWLKEDAAPTIFNFPAHLQPKASSRKRRKQISEEQSPLADTDVRKKWKYLRDQFCVESGKAEVLHEHGLTSQDPRWPHYQSLSFLKDVVKPRQNASQTKIKLEKAAVDEQTMDPNKDEETELGVKIHSIGTVIQDDGAEDTSGLKRKRTDSDGNETANEPDSRIGGFQVYQVIPTGLPENDDFLFFRSLLPYVSQIPSHLKLRFRNKVQELVDEFVFQS